MNHLRRIFDGNKPGSRSSEQPNAEDQLAALDIPSCYARIEESANAFLQLLGPGFTRTPDGHIVTDIAGAASVAGHMLLRGQGLDLSNVEPGTLVLSDIHAAQEAVFRFMVNAAYSMGLDPKSGWDKPHRPTQAPRMDTPELLARLLPGFLAICQKSGLSEAYFPYVAALAAIKLVAAGDG